jgi:hypothetical protein
MEALQSLLASDSRLRYLGKTKLKAELRGKVPGKIIDQHFAEDQVRQVLKPVVASRTPAKLVITGPPRSFQIDVAVFGRPAVNGGYGYALLLVDILSRRAWLYPMKTHKMTEVMTAYRRFVADLGSSPKMLMGDDEFAAAAFRQYNEELGVSLYTDVAANDHQGPDGGDKLGIIDRLTKTLKDQLALRQATEDKAGRWKALIPSVIDDYNDTKHRTIGRTPNEAFGLPQQMQEQVHTQQMLQNATESAAMPKFEPGDRVRVLLNRDTFDRSRARWSTDVYTVKAQQGYKYVVPMSARKTELYKPNELQRVTGAAANPKVAKTFALEKAVDTQAKARKRITSVKEGISVDAEALAGKASKTTETRAMRAAKGVKTRSVTAKAQ